MDEKKRTAGLMLQVWPCLECESVRSDPFRRVHMPQVPQEEYEKIARENARLKEDREFYSGTTLTALLALMIFIAFM